MNTPTLATAGSKVPVTAFPAKSIHHETVSQLLPDWLRSTSPARVNALKKARIEDPHWHKDAATSARQGLREAVERNWAAQNQVDSALRDLQDVSTFAKAQLQKALKDRFGIEDDVEQTWLHLYVPVKSAWWVIDHSGATTSRFISMLDAALHNFSADEVFHPDSAFITRPDSFQHYSEKNYRGRLSLEQFKALCRELDLGARYQQHLKDHLLPTDKAASNVLRNTIILSQKSALNVAAHMALMKNDIDQAAFTVIQGMLDERSGLQWQGQAVGYHNLEMMDTHLTGIVLIAADSLTATGPLPVLDPTSPAAATQAVPVIAYVPHDPEHPLKQYPSSTAFMVELTRQLRDGGSGNSYQQFFSQFVPQQQRGHFFAGLNDRLSQIKWQPVPPGSSLPTWRETALDNPNLEFRAVRIQDDRETVFKKDLWTYFYRQKLNKIFNDARELAISTEYVDRMARWAWWDNLEKILSDILNVAVLVATPFVPGLGELMMAYTAFQLTYDTLEGIVDLAEGRLAEAGLQILGVLESVVQLGAFAAAGAVGSIAQTRLSPFFEDLKPVQLANGETRLWNPDLTPYQQSNVALAPDARPDAQGIHLHQGRRIVRIDDQPFEVLEDPATGQQRIRHPQRPDAYAPTLRHNGEGAWVCETENPRDWQGSTLMRRLGHSTDGFSNIQLEQIRQISSTDEAALRRVHVDNTPAPPLLSDSLQRLATPPIAPAALSAEAAPLFNDFPELPATVAEKIIAGASESESQRIKQEKRLPLRLKTQARELQFETLAVRAAQGFYPGAAVTADTERLALGTLRINSDTFGNLRIEIRQATFDGELRSSAGPEDAARVRVLIRDDAGQYALRDGEDRPIDDADDFIPTLLQATQDNGQNVLGYKAGDGEKFRQWLLAKSEPPTERRTLLASAPIRPVAEPETLLLVRGGGYSKEGKTLHERIEDLHPHFSEAEVNRFAAALTERGDPMNAIQQQENDLKELQVILNDWEITQPQTWGPDPQGFLRGGGKRIADGLIDCFERTGTELGSRTDPLHYSLDLSSELLPLNLDTWWSQRPRLNRFLEKVSHLKLDNTRFSAETNGLLKDFPNLRELSASGCELTRLPEGIAHLQRIERLRLSDNQIALDDASVKKLKDLTYLEILRLDKNPLGQSVDISRMPRLKVVGLRDTGSLTWPQGTFNKPRPRGFLLDLRNNPISLIPEVVPASADARVVARTRLDVGRLTDLNQVHYQQYRRSVQLPEEPVESLDSQIEEVLANYSDEQWNDVPGWGVSRATMRAELAHEPGAVPFLARLYENQINAADTRAGGEAEAQLAQRTWRMLDAVHIDSALREKLFTMAVAPVDCADAGAQLFNSMGVQVLVSEAYSYSITPSEVEQKLVTLAKGAARLEWVNEVARADVASRGGTPDDVEVYLAYQTGLAERLDLPWQSRGMLFRPVSGVTDAMIDLAYDTVLDLSAGDGLVDRMLEQDFWQNYLNEQYPVRMELNKQRYQALADQLETLRTTQREWTQASSDSQRAELRAQLRALTRDLPVPDTVVFADQPFSDATYDRLLVDLGDEEKALARRLTREAMKRAGL